MIVRTLDMLPIECVVRGYLTGSGWKEYVAEGTVCGIPCPPACRTATACPNRCSLRRTRRRWEHDENISFARAEELVGAERAAAARPVLEIYRRAARPPRRRADPRGHEVRVRGGCRRRAHPGRRGAHERLVALLGCRRLGARDDPAERMASFDKQIVRDWLAAAWNGQGTPPELPAEIVERTAKYRELLEKLTD
jgi:phosphoribosylaminoimidazole-succinocarboxamide synthase